MKRVLLSILGTVLGVAALLSFKSHGQGAANGSGLPSAALPAVSASTTTSPSRASTAAPPDPAASVTGQPPGAATTAATGSTSASFLGDSVNTRYGIVQVKITVTGNTITNVGFAQLTAFDGRSRQINSAAAPILLHEALNAQSAQIDSVSGASYTSQGYTQSLQSALDRAGFK
jgi:uncharacterized protein with FMN-binding domain